MRKADSEIEADCYKKQILRQADSYKIPKSVNGAYWLDELANNMFDMKRKSNTPSRVLKIEDSQKTDPNWLVLIGQSQIEGIRRKLQGFRFFPLCTMIQKFPFITGTTGTTHSDSMFSVKYFDMSIRNGFWERHGCRCAFMSDNASALSFMVNSER